ncbi:helix-turn-helix transcriptional regulator [Deinococcus fonticola]|uniref:helix-turn-helix transcriptional regulator n=1 Tax=Deinococcus fonticola TaxID=2528713 RepID=UPI00107516F1|nr:metalloregulator ArsR/SmtB family transcription factor [Deinococcus fonticola]
MSPSSLTAPSPSLAPAPERTKNKLLELIKRCGPLTAQDIACKLEISIPAARRHLLDLQEHALIESRTERPSGRGRPQHVFALTERGEAAFPKTYANLCLDVLKQVQTMFGDDAVLRVLEARNMEHVRQWREQLPADLPLPERLERLSTLLTRLGFDAVIESDGEALFLVQRNCPNLTVARQHRELCAAELRLYRDVLGTELRRELTIACGQGTCRYRIG